LVTGASRGIGRAIAVELSKTHAVVATYRGNVEAAKSLHAETGADIIRSDISSADDRQALVAHLQAGYDRVDLLVNNAGMAPRERRDILDATEASYDELLATNLKGPHFLTQLAARWMLERPVPERQSPRIARFPPVLLAQFAAYAWIVSNVPKRSSLS